MMFCEIIGIIVNAASPVDQKFTLANPVADPIESHVDCFGAALFDRGIDDSGGASVVGLNGSGRLGVA